MDYCGSKEMRVNFVICTIQSMNQAQLVTQHQPFLLCTGTAGLSIRIAFWTDEIIIITTYDTPESSGSRGETQI